MAKLSHEQLAFNSYSEKKSFFVPQMVSMFYVHKEDRLPYVYGSIIGQ